MVEQYYKNTGMSGFKQGNVWCLEIIVCIGVSIAPLFCQAPPPLPLNLQTVQAPLFYANSPFILVFQDPSLPPKIGFLSEPPY